MSSGPAGAAKGGVVLYTDGAARGNPGPAGIGVVALRDKEQVFTISRYIGFATNNMAEYMALIAGLEKAAELAVKEVTVMLDSELVERQMNGAYKVKDSKLKVLHSRASRAVRPFERCSFIHVPRGKNADADRLANEALDNALKKAKEESRT